MSDSPTPAPVGPPSDDENLPPSGFEVFTAEDGEPAIRMTKERYIASLEGQLNRWREVIEGYKQTQDELVDENVQLKSALEACVDALIPWQNDHADAEDAIKTARAALRSRG